MKPQEAIRIMKIAIAEVEWEYPMDYAAAFETAIEALEKQATSDWIPVSERPPEDPDESVLITVNGTYKNITFEDAVMLATYDKDEGWIIDGYQYWLTAQVTAWQPLPEPYKEEKDGK